MANEIARAVEVTPVGGVACTSVIWSIEGRLRVTVIAKMTFIMTPDGVMTPAPRDEILTAEVHHQRNPTRSVRFTSDLAPYVPRCDVVVNGSAHAPSGKPAQTMQVRLAVLREADPVLDKTITVRGDEAGGGITPFERIPIMYERAYGGIGWEENPLGTGVGAAGAQPPNLIDPASPTRVMCFAPIARGWPHRKRLLGPTDRKALDKPIAEIPPGIDWSYFHASPPDQRVDHLNGDEWIVLEGMHRDLPIVRSRLPFARGQARVYGLGDTGGGRPLPLAADLLRIESDELRCSLVFRGSFPIPDASAISVIRVAAGVELGGRPLDWPTLRIGTPLAPEIVALARSLDATAPFDHASTVALEEDPGARDRPVAKVEVIRRIDAATPVASERQEPSLEDVTDFVTTANAEDEIVTPKPDRPAERWASTIAMEDTDARTPKKAATPFVRAPATPVAAPIAPRIAPSPLDDEDSSGAGTLIIDARGRPTTDERQVLPFGSGPANLPPTPSRPEAPQEHELEGTLVPATIPLDDRAAQPVRAIPERWAPAAPATPAPEIKPSAAPRRTRVAASTTSQGIQLFHPPLLALGVEPWRMTPSRDCVTVIAKIVADLPSGAPASMRAAAEPLAGEQHASGDARRGLARASDLALFKARADVTLVGHAVAPGGSARAMEVVFRFGADPVRFERRLAVFGDRRWEKGLAALRPSAPEPFQRMPIAWERAFGGQAFDANPIGVGHPGSLRRGDARSPLPNLEDPEHLLRTPNQTPRPACLGPIPLAWKDRFAKLGWKRQPWPLFPEDFDWSRYQSAPAEQQTSYLRGDEPYFIEGLSAEPLEGALPGVRVRCFVEASQGAFDELPMRLDTAAFDLDDGKLTLVWRGALGVPDEAAPGLDAIHAIVDRDLDGGRTIEELSALLLG